ncbi:MAG: hypothetical protein ABI723_22875 [Bacteroidia bacterium]
MRLLVIGCWLWVSSCTVNAQQFSLIKTIPTTAKFFTTDKLGNFYTIEQNEIRKYNSDGDSLCSYNYKNLGTINYLDATDPFKVMLFQPEFLKIRTLDSRLNIQGEIDLNYFNDLGLPRLACVTDDGNFWIYDQQNQRLIKIDQKGNILLTGNSFNQLIDHSLNPRLLVATDTWLMMRNADSTVYIFDKFGNYYRNIPLIVTGNFQATENRILYFKENRLYTLDIDTGKESILETPELTGTSAVRMEQHRLYVKKANALEVYSF